MTSNATGRMTEAATCPCCVRPMFPKTVSTVLRSQSAPPPVLRGLRGLRGRRGTKGGAPTAEWVASWARVQDTPDDIRPRLLSLGARALRNLTDFGWITEKQLLDHPLVKSALEKAIFERSASKYAAPPLPPSAGYRTVPRTFGPTTDGEFK
jgi:hypothetical protein